MNGDYPEQNENRLKEPKPCPGHNCGGTVYPIENSDFGECDKCKRRFPWRDIEKIE